MKSFEVKIAKANAIIWYQKHQLLTNLFRVIEILIFIIIISKFSTQYPFVIRFSSDHFKGLSFAVFSPRFVFVIGNLIILILLFKSRVVENGECNEKTDNVYEEYVKRCEKSVVNRNSNSNSNTSNVVTSNEKRICRTRSEKMMRVEHKENQAKLRRSVTERKIVKKIDCGGGDMVGPEKRCVADELSNDEFRRTVEAFIARQQQSLRDEELAPVPYIGA